MLSLLNTRRVPAIAAAFVALAIAGCGGAAEEEQADLIPQETAATLQSLLDDARAQFREGECDELEATIADLDREGDRMPDAEVNRELRTTLNAGIVRLGELADNCEPAEEEVVPVAPAPVEPVEPVEPVPVPVEPPPEPEEEPEEDQEQSDREQQQQNNSGGQGGQSNGPPQGSDPSRPPSQDPCANNAPRC